MAARALANATDPDLGLEDLLGLNCTADTDCPVPGQVCYLGNLTINTFDVSACFCNAWYGWVDLDDTCDGRSATFFFLLISLAAQVFLSVSITMVSAIDAGRLITQLGIRLRKVRSVAITSISLPLAALFFLLWRFLTIGSLIAPDEAIFIEGTGAAGRFELVIRPFIFFCLLFAAICVGSLSLMWISIAERVRSMQVESVSQWREILGLLGVFIFLSLGVVALTIEWSISVMVSLPFLMILISSLFIGRSRMIRLLKVAIELENRAYGETASGNSAHKERRALHAISATGLHVILGLSGIFCTGTANFLMVGVLREQSVHSFDSIGGFSSITAVQEAGCWCVIYILCAMFVYVHRNTNKLLSGPRYNRGVVAQSGIFTTSDMPTERKTSLNPLILQQSVQSYPL